MKTNIEKEYAMLLEEETFARIRDQLPMKKVVQANHYYRSKTPNTGIRIREIDGKYIFTLKERKGEDTLEHEALLDHLDINDPKAMEILKAFHEEDTIFIGTMETIRYICPLKYGEIDLDESHYLGMTDYEIEYELYDPEVGDDKEIKELLHLFQMDWKENEVTKYARFLKRRSEMKAAILCADGLEEGEALVTYDLLKRAGIDVRLVSIYDHKTIHATHGLCFECNELLSEIHLDDYLFLILPGGLPGADYLKESPMVQKTLEQFYEEKKYIAAICAAPYILREKGWLKDRMFSCYPGFEGNLKTSEEPLSIDHTIITAKALGSVFLFAHRIITIMKNQKTADAVLEEIYY